MQGQPVDPAERDGRTGRPGRHPVRLRGHPEPGGGRMRTAVGEFELREVELATDLPLLAEWMNDPAVAAYWDLAGPPETTERHIAPQLGPDSHSCPLLGLLDGTPMSYWELYRADVDRLAGYYPAGQGDLGLHLLLGPPGHRGRGIGALLLTALADRLLAEPGCDRLVAEPDLRNTPSLRAFRRAGFDPVAELELPEKRAALMLRQQ
nr:GNAT family N-acetyltransferase [Kitasatospora gansuensis]